MVPCSHLAPGNLAPFNGGQDLLQEATALLYLVVFCKDNVLVVRPVGHARETQSLSLSFQYVTPAG